MNLISKVVLLVTLGLAATGSFAKEKKGDPLKDTIKQINAALAKNDAVAAQAAFARAQGLRSNYPDKKFAPAITAVGKGVGNKDTTIALAAIQTLGAMRMPGSSKSLKKYLSPTAKVAADQIPLFAAAMTSAGMIADRESTNALSKAAMNPNEPIAVAAAMAFGGYTALDEKPSRTLQKKLVQLLGSLEKRAKTAKGDKAKAAATAAAGALNASLVKLTGKQGVTSAKDWTAYLKERAKEAKKA